MDILAPLPKSIDGNEFISVITDRFSKATRTIPLKTTTATDVAMALLTHWVYSYGLPLYLLTDNGNQLLSKFFPHVYATLGTKHVTTTAYHPQTNGQSERFNKTLVNSLVHYTAEH